MSPCLLCWICPVCHLPLQKTPQRWFCEQGHSFDVARQGYVNLLLGKRPQITGDTRDMLLARRRFLAAGFFDPLVEMVVAELGEIGKRPLSMLDAGCGEGSYMQAIHNRTDGNDICLAGTDYSKEATRLAAAINPAAQFAVADLTRFIPLASGSVDVILNIFAPRNVGEYGRISTPGGTLLIVIPGPNHLHSLRQSLKLLEIEANKQILVRQQMAPSFRLEHQHNLTFAINLTGESLADLIMMTPNAWHLRDEQKSAIAEITATSTEAEFWVMLFKKIED